MDVDLSTDLRGLLPLVAPLMSGHSDLAIGTRLAHGSRVVRGPKREFISRGYNRILRTMLRARFSDAQCGFKAVRRDALDGLLDDVAGRGLVLRHRAAGARPAARAAHPRGAGGLGRRPGLARGHRAAPRSPTCAASRGCSPPARSRASWRSACSARSPTRSCTSRCTRCWAPAGANAAALALTAVGNTAANRRVTFGVRGREDLVRHHVRGAVVFVLTLALTNGALAVLHGLDAAPARGRRAGRPDRRVADGDDHALRRAAHVGVRTRPYRPLRRRLEHA